MTVRNTDVPLTALALAGGWYGYALAEMPVAFREDNLDHLVPTPDEWPVLLNQLHPDPSLVPGYAVLKFSRSVEVCRVTPSVGGRSFDLIIKRSRREKRRMADYIRGGREHRNFQRALNMRAIGIKTALPLAVLERRTPHRGAYIVTAFVPTVMDLETIATTHLAKLDERIRVRTKLDISCGIVRTLKILHDNGLVHRDLKASNIMLANWTDVGVATDVFLIDLDGIQRARVSSDRRRWTMLARLFASLGHYHYISRTDAARFLRRYIDMTGATDEWKVRFRQVTNAARQYNIRAQGRKRNRGKLDGFLGE